MAAQQPRAWRDEKVIIAFKAHALQLRSLVDKDVGEWVVVPPYKVVSPGQTVTWKSVPSADMELFLPDVFEPEHVKGNGEVSARVKDKAPNGFVLYEAFCDGQLATGGSSPGMIVDP